MKKRQPILDAKTASKLSFFGLALATLTHRLIGQSAPIAGETQSPQPESPQASQLPSRAIPVMSESDENAQDSGYVKLYRLTKGYYDNIFAPHLPETPYVPDPSLYRSVTAYEPIQGLLPLRPSNELIEFHPFVGLAESYDSNILQTSTRPVGDFFTTISGAGDLQIGTADSVYNEGYDTILALHAKYLLWYDAFANHPNFDALNQKLDVDGRIGRNAAIWRPYFNGSEITGNNYLTEERDGRIRRQRLSTGLEGDYQLTSQLTWGQNFSFSGLNHPMNPDNLNTAAWQSYQELGLRVLPDFNALVWTEYRDTAVSRGSHAQEFTNGFGWRGKPDPRLSSEVLVGWDAESLEGAVPYRRDLSGIRMRGHTSFEWGPRLRLTLKYDRGYTFNEVTKNNNYVNNSIQLIPEIFLGGNWYLNPYLGVSYNEFELSSQRTFEVRPEMELSYQLPNNRSRIFGRVGYDYFQNLNGPANPVNIYRLNLGLNWTF